MLQASLLMLASQLLPPSPTVADIPANAGVTTVAAVPNCCRHPCKCWRYNCCHRPQLLQTSLLTLTSQLLPQSPTVADIPANAGVTTVATIPNCCRHPCWLWHHNYCRSPQLLQTSLLTLASQLLPQSPTVANIPADSDHNYCRSPQLLQTFLLTLASQLLPPSITVADIPANSDITTVAAVHNCCRHPCWLWRHNCCFRTQMFADIPSDSDVTSVPVL